ncbi:MAG TPA: hypothetical protein VLN73_01770 [Alphaproteobacteria bacterium]|nr:hypothetical protein [Alphaproteobacteria bacterium]
MFGFSLSKLLVLILIIAAIWYGFKWVGRLDRERKERLKEDRSRPGDRGSRDLIECTACGAYVAPGLDECPEGRADCPMLRS